MDRSKFWLHGYRDYFKDESLVNPYHSHSYEYQEWENGRRQAEFDRWDDGKNCQ